MSWLTKALSAPFPKTSDIYWTVVLGLAALVLLMVAFGELMWLAGVKNWTALTWYVRYTVPFKWLIVWAVVSGSTMAWLIFHFIWGSGWKTGPNI